jgi:integrase
VAAQDTARLVFPPLDSGGIVSAETKPELLTLEEIQAMQNRRYQQPKPEPHGKFWTVRVWIDVFKNGRPARKQVRWKLGKLDEMNQRQAAKAATQKLAPLNLGLQTINAGMSFEDYVQMTYIPAEMPLLAASTRSRYQGVLDKYLLPVFADCALGELTVHRAQLYFNGFAESKLKQESREKIWTVLSAVMASAIKCGCISRNPCHGVKLPAAKHGRAPKPHITAEQFNHLLALIPEPYASMLFVSTLTGLRISELVGLKWNDVGTDSLTIDERYCRGDWGAPKSDASNATVPVLPAVLERIQRLKGLSVRIGGGRGKYQTFKLVKSDAPDALVFQSVKQGKPMRDNNVLTRHIKPAGRKLGIPWVNWRCLRTSFATLLKEKGVHVRDAQALMRHSRASTTLDIYQQTTDAHQRAALRSLESVSAMVQ